MRLCAPRREICFQKSNVTCKIHNLDFIPNMDSPPAKRQAFYDLSNISPEVQFEKLDSPPAKRQAFYDLSNNSPEVQFQKDWFPVKPINDYPLPPPTSEPVPQNVHPYLSLYQEKLPENLESGNMSHEELSKLLSNVDEGPMLDFLAGMGVIATEQQCEFCGGNMKRVKDGKSWYFAMFMTC